MKTCVCNISHIPVLQPVFCTHFLVFLQAAIPHPLLLLPGKAPLAGEVADAELGILEKVSPTEWLTWEILLFHECLWYDRTQLVLTGRSMLKSDLRCPKPCFSFSVTVFVFATPLVGFSISECCFSSWCIGIRIILKVKVILVASLLLNSLQWIKLSVLFA